MKIYTKKGDAGETDLLGGSRAPKDAARIEACGAVDELNAVLGPVRQGTGPEISLVIGRLQNDLFSLGAELAAESRGGQGLGLVSSDQVRLLETDIDECEQRLPTLDGFILPGGTEASAMPHLARSVRRRAERRVVGVDRQSGVPPLVLQYLNRLGDLLFILGRAANLATGQPEVHWRK